MQYLVYAYIGVFALMAIAMCVGELLSPPSERDPIWETVCDIIAAGIFLAGMVFFVFGTDSDLLKTMWLILAPISAAYVLVSSLRARKKQRTAATAEDKRAHFAFADFGTVAFVIPALAINILFALQGPITTENISWKALHQIPDPPLVESLMAISPSTSKSTLALGQGSGELLTLCQEMTPLFTLPDAFSGMVDVPSGPLHIERNPLPLS